MHTNSFARIFSAYSLLIAALFSSQTATASPQPLFSSTTPLDITLTGPWSKLASDSAAEPEWRAGALTLNDGQQFNLKVAPRGKSRRRKDFCSFPPLRLDFKRAEVEGSVFEGQNKLKLVTHCGRLGIRNKDYSDRLHSEYLLYRIFQESDPRSFSVRAVRITYVDSKNQKSYIHPGFFIEHKRALADRIGGQLLEQQTVPLADLDSNYAATAALFAYFAGNTDFAFTTGPKGENCCHNAVPMQVGSRVLAVPYDFDATGFVNPPYAGPLPELNLKTLTQRRHRGYCRHKAQVPQAVAAFQQAQPAVTALINNHDSLTPRRKKKLLRFMEDFYATLNDPKKRDRRLLKTCR